MAKPKGKNKASGIKISFGKRKKVKGKKKVALHARKSASHNKTPLISPIQKIRKAGH